MPFGENLILHYGKQNEKPTHGVKLNIFFRLEKAWFGARQKLVSSLNYEFCFGENLILHYGKQNEKPTHAKECLL